MRALNAQIGELTSARGQNNTELIRDLANQLAPLVTLNNRLKREAAQRQREALKPIFVDDFGDGDGFGDGIGVDSGKCNGTRNPILLRYFFVCLGGWNTMVHHKLVFDRCMKLYSSEWMRQLNQSRALTHGQEPRCDCGRKFQATSGVIVEISQGGQFWYTRAPYPVEGLDTRPELPLRLECLHSTIIPDQFQVRPRIYSKCLLTHQAGGLALFESHEIFLMLPMIEWEPIYQFAASLE
jgi:hypothetical protein